LILGWRRRATVAVATVALLAVVGCGSTVSPTPGSSATAPATSATASGAGPAPTCGPIPPVAPPSGLDQAGWWRDRTFYEVFVRSFADGDGDGIGDLKGLIGKLDYFNDNNVASQTDLGITALWLMPTFPSPSYHGYDVTDYRAVNPDYGSLDDLRELVKEAHRRGIAVILDLPLNHTSDEHPWFVGSKTGTGPYADWYRWSDAPQGNGWQPDGSRFYYAAFGADLPDLNLTNPDVTAEVTADVEFWLGTAGVDGFRLDAAKYLVEDGPTTENTPETHAWWRTFRSAVDAQVPRTLLLGEVWDLPKVSASYVPADLDLTFDFALDTGYVGAAQSGDAATLMRLMTNVTKLYPATSGFGAFLSNHDMNRVATQLDSDPGQLGVAADLLLTGPGVPFVYYGEEIGLTGAKPDERIRTPMRWDASSPAAGFSSGAPWESMSDDPPSLNVADESASNSSLLSRYRNLIHLRQLHPALSSGTWAPVASDSSSVVAALRVAPTETALVLTNVSTEPVSPTLSLESSPLCGRPAVFGAYGQTVTIGPELTAAGGFHDYRPVATLQPQSTVVILLGP